MPVEALQEGVEREKVLTLRQLQRKLGELPETVWEQVVSWMSLLNRMERLPEKLRGLKRFEEVLTIVGDDSKEYLGHHLTQLHCGEYCVGEPPMFPFQ